MTESTSRAPATTSAATTSQFLATIAIVLAVAVLLLIVDMSLARADRRASAAFARTLYDEGRDLLARGNARGATDRFASAFALQRSNKDYELALAQALLDDGRAQDAEATLATLLARAETDGAVNIAMGRVLVREGRKDEARSYYHRAVYGRWSGDSVAARAAARLELIELLASQQAKQELLAELLPLEETMPDSLPLQRRIGHLFIVAGSPGRAANVFRSILRRAPDDGDAYEGLGEAALALGSFRAARTDLIEAARLMPGDSNIARQRVLVDSVWAMNPLERGLSTHERYVRARAMLARTIAMAEACALPTATHDALRDSSRQSLARTQYGSDEGTESDRLVALANDLYATILPSCANLRTTSGRILTLIQARMSQ